MSRPPATPGGVASAGVFDALPREPSPYDSPPADPPQHDPPQVVPTGKAGSWGCLWSGCLGAILLTLVIVIVAGFGTYRLYKKQIGEFTSPEARQLPVVELSPEELAELETRVEALQEPVEQDEAPEPLVLDSDDLNALISQQEQLRGRVFVTIENGLIQAEVSFPADSIPGAKGRYFNASASINASLDDGELIVTLDNAEVNGHPVPEAFMAGFRKQNLAKDVNENPEVAEMIDRFERLAIEGDKLILTPRTPRPSGEADAAAETKAETEPEAGLTNRCSAGGNAWSRVFSIDRKEQDKKMEAKNVRAGIFFCLYLSV